MSMRSWNSERTIYLKGCPRCKGDIRASQDEYGKYIHCLQCGYAADVERPNMFTKLSVNVSRDDVA